MSQVQFEKLKEADEETAKITIQAIQQEIDESAKLMVAQNAEHQKQKEELEGKNLVIVIPIANPKANGWHKIKNSITISTDGLNATNSNGRRSVSAEKGYNISVDISGPLIYYFEVTITMMSSSHRRIHVGFSRGNVPNSSIIGLSTNSYANLSGKEHDFEWPNGATKPESKGPGDVLGCGLLLNAESEVSIFFTGNGLLMGTQIPINFTMDTLYPAVSMDVSASIEANFGDDSAKFKYDIEKCPGLVFE